MRNAFYVLICAVAFSCMTYELVLAQISSALLGNALLRYTMTIGLYLASLGLGALAAGRLDVSKYTTRLFWTEIALVFIGGLSPLIAVACEYLLRQSLDPTGAAFDLALQAVMYTVTIVVGFLAGLELPILVQIGESRLKVGGGRVLAVDQLGTLAALVVFSWALLPGYGVFMAAGVACAISCIGAAFTLFFLPKEEADFKKMAALACGVLLSVGLQVGHGQLGDAVSRSIYTAEVR